MGCLIEVIDSSRRHWPRVSWCPSSRCSFHLHPCGSWFSSSRHSFHPAIWGVDFFLKAWLTWVANSLLKVRLPLRSRFLSEALSPSPYSLFKVHLWGNSLPRNALLSPPLRKPHSISALEGADLFLHGVDSTFPFKKLSLHLLEASLHCEMILSTKCLCLQWVDSLLKMPFLWGADLLEVSLA